VDGEITFLQALHKPKVSDYFLNNTYLGSLNKEPFNFSFAPSAVAGISDSAVLKIVAYDKVRNKTEVSVPIKLNY